MIGFDTIGNATIIAYDGEPVLATDPWIAGSAYFGSWGLSHEIPRAQQEAILACPYIWFSHGHPDHINHDSLVRLADKTVLLADHVGGRIARDLTEGEVAVRVLPDRVWVELSPAIKVMSIADYNQDSLLLIDINGRLLVNLNDGSALGAERFVKRITREYPTSFLLRLFSYGDADMINYVGEDGARIPPAAVAKRAIGPIMQGFAEFYGVTYVIPFSCFHRYQRADSVWANEYTTPVEAFREGFDSRHTILLPAFIRYDCVRDTWTELAPATLSGVVRAPEEFDDDWSDVLDARDKQMLKDYFSRLTMLENKLDTVIFSVGGRDYAVDIAEQGGAKTNRSVTFAVPRYSLMQAVEHQVFDDLLIGNFMRTTLHGAWGASYLYPHFSPVVPKYADNGGVRTPAELGQYFASYRARAPLEFLRHRLEARTIQTFRSMVEPRSPFFYAGKKSYLALRKLLG